jgi:SAM-dependent methyltransferase
MAGWTKADYDDAYRDRPECYMATPCPTNERSPVVIGYCRKFIEPYLHSRIDKLLDVLTIESSDRVVIVGCGFGWGSEYLKEKTGCQVVGTDISDWIHATKEMDESEDIREAIAKTELDPNGERAAEILAYCLTPGPRSHTQVLHEDLMTTESRQRLRFAFSHKDPTWLITEDMIQTLDDDEIVSWGRAVESFGAGICHLHNGQPRSNAELQKLTGHTCFQY